MAPKKIDSKTTTELAVFVMPGSIPANQNAPPTQATSQISPHRPTARSITTVVTATVRRLCSRAMKAALIMSPPTEPGKNVLK